MQSNDRAVQVGHGNHHPRAHALRQANRRTRLICRGDSIVDDLAHFGCSQPTNGSCRRRHQIPFGRRPGACDWSDHIVACGEAPGSHAARAGRLVHEWQGDAGNNHSAGRRQWRRGECTDAVYCSGGGGKRSKFRHVVALYVVQHSGYADPTYYSPVPKQRHSARINRILIAVV